MWLITYSKSCTVWRVCSFRESLLAVLFPSCTAVWLGSSPSEVSLFPTGFRAFLDSSGLFPIKLEFGVSKGVGEDKAFVANVYVDRSSLGRPVLSEFDLGSLLGEVALAIASYLVAKTPGVGFRVSTSVESALTIFSLCSSFPFRGGPPSSALLTLWSVFPSSSRGRKGLRGARCPQGGGTAFETVFPYQ